MSIYAWPAAWGITRFEMRVVPNLRAFVGQYTPNTQVLDLLGERWAVTVDLARSFSSIEAAAREAWFDRLKGGAHQFAMWHLRLPVPQGTLRDGLPASVVNGSAAAVTVVNGSAAAVTMVYGTPSTAAAVPQGANTALLRHIPGRTLLAGDLFGLAGELKRCMENVVFDSGGQATVEFQPRARRLIPVGTEAVWNKPTANFMVKGDGVPTGWVSRHAEGASFDAIEVI